jgi:hypothetical protein
MPPPPKEPRKVRASKALALAVLGAVVAVIGPSLYGSAMRRVDAGVNLLLPRSITAKLCGDQPPTDVPGTGREDKGRPQPSACIDLSRRWIPPYLAPGHHLWLVLIPVRVAPRDRSEPPKEVLWKVFPQRDLGTHGGLRKTPITLGGRKDRTYVFAMQVWDVQDGELHTSFKD